MGRFPGPSHVTLGTVREPGPGETHKGECQIPNAQCQMKVFCRLLFIAKRFNQWPEGRELRNTQKATKIGIGQIVFKSTVFACFAYFVVSGSYIRQHTLLHHSAVPCSSFGIWLYFEIWNLVLGTFWPTPVRGPKLCPKLYAFASALYCSRPLC